MFLSIAVILEDAAVCKNVVVFCYSRKCFYDDILVIINQIF